ncbi:hypothetical protein NWF32_14710 [Pseudomonas qingdaonensis]|nr:hypothetical protein [Pseudomonas qingdaonensis]
MPQRLRAPRAKRNFSGRSRVLDVWRTGSQRCRQLGGACAFRQIVQAEQLLESLGYHRIERHLQVEGCALMFKGKWVTIQQALAIVKHQYYTLWQIAIRSPKCNISYRFLHIFHILF